MTWNPPGPPDPETGAAIVMATKILEDIKANGDLERFKNSLAPAVITHGRAAGKQTDKTRTFSHNDKVLYVCNKTPDCTYVNYSEVKVHSHMPTHTKRGEVPPSHQPSQANPTAKKIENLAMQIAELAEQLTTTPAQAPEVKVSKTQERWKERALKAEKELKELKKATSALRSVLGKFD